MNKLLLGALLGSLTSMSVAGTCVGPAPCPTDPCFGPDGCTVPTDPVPGPSELCIANACSPVIYIKQIYPGTVAGPAELGYFIQAYSLVAGYPVMGWNGPCLPNWECPAIYQGAFEDLYNNAARVNRVMRFDAE